MEEWQAGRVGLESRRRSKVRALSGRPNHPDGKLNTETPSAVTVVSIKVLNRVQCAQPLWFFILEFSKVW